MSICDCWIKFTLYLSLLSGYLIAAYLSGRNFKNIQARLINTVFAISSSYFAFSHLINVSISTRYSQNPPRLYPEAYLQSTSLLFNLGFVFLMFLGMRITIPFSIRLMGEIRRTVN
jgi:hypothetical protein